MLRFGDPTEAVEAAAEIESLGYTSVLVPDFGGDDLYASLDRLLGATTTATIGTGVVNIWLHTPDAANAWWHGLAPADQGRVMFGVGVSHLPLIGEQWGRPLEKMNEFLDRLEVPVEHRCLAAMAPKMLQLARERSAGSFPNHFTPEHTAMARDALGPDGWLAVNQSVLLERDPDVARALAREELQLHASLPNFTNSWKRVGFTDDDIATLSDRLVDAMVAWGDVDLIAERVAEQRAAGADHVTLDVMPSHTLQREAWKALAGI